MSTVTPEVPPPPGEVVAAPVRRMENGKGLLLMGLGMLLFSAVDTGAKFLTEGLHPLQIVWTRQLGLLAGAIALLVMTGPVIFRTRHLRLQILRGAVAAGSAFAFITAVAYVPLADAVAISFVAPFMVTVAGALILKEPVGIRRWAAVVLGFIGTLIIIRPGTGAVHPAAVLVIVAAALFAARQIISRALSDTDRTQTTVAYTALVGSAILTLPLPLVWQAPTAEEMPILIGIAVLAGLAEVAVIRALECAMAVVVAPVQYTLMLWSTLWGWFVFGQLPDGWTWIGAGIIILTGIYMLRREHLAVRRKRRGAHGH